MLYFPTVWSSKGTYNEIQVVGLVVGSVTGTVHNPYLRIMKMREEVLLDAYVMHVYASNCLDASLDALVMVPGQETSPV